MTNIGWFFGELLEERWKSCDVIGSALFIALSRGAVMSLLVFRFLPVAAGKIEGSFAAWDS